MASSDHLEKIFSPEIWPTTITIRELYYGVPAGEYLVHPDKSDPTLAELTPVRNPRNSIDKIKYVLSAGRVMMLTDQFNRNKKIN